MHLSLRTYRRAKHVCRGLGAGASVAHMKHVLFPLLLDFTSSSARQCKDSLWLSSWYFFQSFLVGVRNRVTLGSVSIFGRLFSGFPMFGLQKIDRFMGNVFHELKITSLDWRKITFPFWQEGNHFFPESQSKWKLTIFPKNDFHQKYFFYHEFSAKQTDTPSI